MPPARAEHVGVQPAERGAFGGRVGPAGWIVESTSTAAGSDELPAGGISAVGRAKPAQQPGPARGIGVRPARTIGNKRGGCPRVGSLPILPAPAHTQVAAADAAGGWTVTQTSASNSAGHGPNPRAPRAHAYSTAKKTRRAHCPGSGLNRLIPRQWGLRRSPSVKGQHLVVGRGRGPRRAPASWPSNLSRHAAQNATPALSVSSPTPPAGLRHSRCR